MHIRLLGQFLAQVTVQFQVLWNNLCHNYLEQKERKFYSGMVVALRNSGTVMPLERLPHKTEVQSCV